MRAISDDSLHLSTAFASRETSYARAGDSRLPSDAHAVAESSPATSADIRQQRAYAPAPQPTADAAAGRRVSLQFALDKDLGKTIVKLVDAETGEVIKQLPPEELLAMARALGKSQGVFLRDKV